MSFSSIAKILYSNTQLGGFGLPIAFEGLDYDAKDGQPYIACFVLRADTVQAELGVEGCDLHDGIYQLSINYPKGDGATELLAKADEINNYFKSGLDLTDGNIIVNIWNVSASPLILSGGWAAINLSIEYQTYTKRIQ